MALWQDVGIRQFLLTNLSRDASNPKVWSFRVPLENIKRSMPQLGDFPFDPPGAADNDGQRPERKWEGPTLFVKGASSK